VPGADAGAPKVTGVELPPGGAPLVVPHGEECEVLLVVRGDTIERIDLVGLDGETGSSMDPLTPMLVLAELPAGPTVVEGAEVDELRRSGQILASAMLVGGAQMVLDVARDHALEREQFGVPIGSFQAVKHLLADCYVRVEMARAATYAAAAVGAGLGDGDPAHAASTAKHLAGEAAVRNSRTAVQVLGGMGFTWEMLPHLFLKRAWVLDQTFGTGAEHAARLGALVGAEVGAG
jgi:hypothetical protein